MKKAYGLLYEIENSLRYIIDSAMKSQYGVGWLIEAPTTMQYKPYYKSFSSLYYHELISLLSAYPCISKCFSSETIISLKKTISIRNKIAHTHILTYAEFEQLKYVSERLQTDEKTLVID